MTLAEELQEKLDMVTEMYVALMLERGRQADALIAAES